MFKAQAQTRPSLLLLLLPTDDEMNKKKHKSQQTKARKIQNKLEKGYEYLNSYTLNKKERKREKKRVLLWMC